MNDNLIPIPIGLPRMSCGAWCVDQSVIYNQNLEDRCIDNLVYMNMTNSTNRKRSIIHNQCFPSINRILQ